MREEWIMSEKRLDAAVTKEAELTRAIDRWDAMSSGTTLDDARAFLAGQIRFNQIAETNGAVLNTHASRVGDAGSGADGGSGRLRDLDDVLEADSWARASARDWLASSGG